MTPAVLLLAVAQATTLTANERVPLAVVVNTPTGQAARTSSSELIRILDDLLRRHTDYFVQLVDETIVRDCQGNLTCVTLTARRDYKRESLIGPDRQPLPFDEHLKRLEERGTPVPRQLLMLSNVSGGESGDRLSVLLLDTDRALRIYHEAPRKPGYTDEVEIRISEQAVLGSPPPSRIMDEAEATTYLSTTFDRHLASALSREGHWEPYGTVTVKTNVPGVAVELDGVAIGTAETDAVEISGVRPGQRELTLRRVGYETTKTTVVVSTGDRVEATVSLAVSSSGGGNPIPSVVMWSGVAVALAGVALTVYGVSRHDGGVTSHCFDADAACVSTQSFESFGFDAQEVGSPEDVNPPGLRVVPLGYSLALTGASWSLGSWLFEADADVPWISLAAGLVIGALSYGVSVAL